MLHYWYRVLIFFVNCLMIIRGDRVLSTKHCSVLPLSEPKCFLPTKDRTNNPNNEVREINFRVNGSARYRFETNLGYDGENIRLGEDYVNTFGTNQSIVKCEKQRLMNQYKEKFEPKLYKRKNKDLDGELESIPLAQSFIITRREVWKCKKENGQEAFSRIVTEILSKEAFGTVEFGDGFEVTTLSIPYRQSTHSERYNYTVAREIKYIDENDTTLRYDGVVKFMEPPKGATDRRHSVYISHYKDFTTLPTNESNWKENQNELHSDQEISYSQGNTLKPIKLDIREKSSRIIFTDKQPFTGDIFPSSGNTNSAICEIEENSQFCSTEYLPRWSYREKGNEEEKTVDFLKSFIVTKHDIWKCKVQQSQPQVTFYRAVIEYIGKTAIDDILVYQDGKTMYRYVLTNTSRSIGIRQIVYFKEDDPNSSLRYYGGIQLMIPEGLPEKVATEKAAAEKAAEEKARAEKVAAEKSKVEEKIAAQKSKLKNEKKPETMTGPRKSNNEYKNKKNN